MKKISYGESNFKSNILDNSIYIDKTRFIEVLENNHKFPIFLRPRRFGKSLFISTLWYYYDEYYIEIWDDLFSELYIGKNPTPLKSSYQVLFLEFSGIVTDSLESIYNDFLNKIDISLKRFVQKYNYPTEYINLIDKQKTPQAKMEVFFDITNNAKIYFLIDEYDHFANSILGTDFKLFTDIIGKGGFVRSFYETIKTATQKGIVERLFITGVTPVTLDSMTSGFNIGENISNDAGFNELAGFTLEESKIVLKQLQEECPKLDKKNYSKISLISTMAINFHFLQKTKSIMLICSCILSKNLILKTANTLLKCSIVILPVIMEKLCNYLLLAIKRIIIKY